MHTRMKDFWSGITRVPGITASATAHSSTAGQVVPGDVPEVVREAERAVYLSQWRSWEQSALERLAGTRGLACTPLVAGSMTIQLVSYDGDHIGHVRLDRPHADGDCWLAVPKPSGDPVGHLSTAAAAVWMLALVSGRTCRIPAGNAIDLAGPCT
jgi:hypothetical protein